MRAVDVEELAWRWREALEAAQAATASATRAIHRSGLDGELSHLTAERRDVVGALQAMARTHGLQIHLAQLALPASAVQRLLGLPRDVTACVFNLDGVLVPSAALHAAAWKETFDEFVLARSERTRGRFDHFDPVGDYYEHIHAKPRLEGVRALLASRGIRLPEGEPDDPPGAETVHGLANRKREALLRRLRADRLKAYEGSRHYLEVAREAGLHRAVVSASANAQRMLELSGLDGLVEACVDGTMMEREHLRAKPAPDTVIAACRKVSVDPEHAVAFETTVAGVAAAREAGFELVFGVDTDGGSAALRREGADRVVTGLAELLEEQLAA